VEETAAEAISKMSETRVSDLSLEALHESIELSPEGWIIHYGGKRVVIFDDILGVECNIELAEKLGLDPMKAWAIKEQLLERWSPSLDEVRQLFPLIVGEDDNVKLAVLALFTLKLKSPGERIAGLMIEATNSAGKSYFSRQILEPLKDLVIAFSRVTGAYLERAMAEKSLDRSILFLQELDMAPYQLHLSLSEGVLRVGLTEKINGKFEPIVIEAHGQPFLWATSLGWQGSPDLIHRILNLSLDESIEQTRRITKLQSKMSSDLLFRLRMERFARGCVKIFRRLWDSAPDNCIVVIPFLELIQRELTKGDNLSVKFRRDFNKLISLIKGCAILNHKNRVKLSLGGETIIIASFEDFLEVYKLMKAALQPTLTGLNEKDLKVLEALKEIENTTDLPTYSTLAKKTGVPSSTIRHYIAPKLENLGFITIDRETRPHKIELLRDSPSEILDNIEGLRGEAEKLIKDAMTHLSSLSCGQLANVERSPDKASIQEKKPEELAIFNLANDPGFSSQKELESSPVHDWPNGQGEKKEARDDTSSYINVSGGDGLEGG
jgi:hypothetical protein